MPQYAVTCMFPSSKQVHGNEGMLFAVLKGSTPSSKSRMQALHLAKKSGS